MSHCVQLIVGRGDPIIRVLKAWPEAKDAPLLEGWSAVPMLDALYDAVIDAHSDADTIGPFYFDPPGLDFVLSQATKGGGSLVYLETDYFGGVGQQAAACWKDGARISLHEQPGAINAALVELGVTPTGTLDAFDTIGLGKRRSMSDYE